MTCKKEIHYIAKDGTRFETEAECKTYNNLPRVYLVISEPQHTFSSTSRLCNIRIQKVFVHENEANNYMEVQNKIKISMRYYVQVEIVEITTPKTSIQEKITNKQRLHWWSCLFD